MFHHGDGLIGLLVFRQLAMRDFAILIRVETSEQAILGLLDENGHHEKHRQEKRAESCESLHPDLLDRTGVSE